MSKIEWTKVSAGCKFCYAETMAKRLRAMGKPDYAERYAGWEDYMSHEVREAASRLAFKGGQPMRGWPT